VISGRPVSSLRPTSAIVVARGNVLTAVGEIAVAKIDAGRVYPQPRVLASFAHHYKTVSKSSLSTSTTRTCSRAMLPCVIAGLFWSRAGRCRRMTW